MLFTSSSDEYDTHISGDGSSTTWSSQADDTCSVIAWVDVAAGGCSNEMRLTTTNDETTFIATLIFIACHRCKQWSSFWQPQPVYHSYGILNGLAFSSISNNANDLMQFVTIRTTTIRYVSELARRTCLPVSWTHCWDDLNERHCSVLSACMECRHCEVRLNARITYERSRTHHHLSMLWTLILRTILRTDAKWALIEQPRSGC